ncbi:MAG: PAS domain-containing protein, partial [Nitrosomonadales bacterium]|nr:PAS domain-containing protein [Nitrosomonadales bacterium]
MKFLFHPAITLMNRLGYTRKFTLLALMAMIAFATVAYNLYVTLDKEVRISQRELAGLELIKPISQLVRAIQQHRGRLALATSGGDVAGDEYAAIEIRAATAFEETEGKLPPSLKEGENWLRIKADWEYLEREQSSMTVEDSFAAHTRLIEKLLIFLVGIADEYALTLDSQIDTYYLIDTAINKLPGALEHIGQLRAYGSGILVRKQISEEQRINIYKIFGMLDDAHVVLEINLEKTGRYNPALRSSLATAAREIADSSQQVVSAMESDILTGHFSMPPGDFFAKATLAIDKGYAQLYDALLPATAALLKARIERAERVLRASIGIAVLLLLIMAYFAIGIYYSITASVQMLAHSARAFAGGNMRERVNLDTRDELRQIGDSFNEMAEGFDAMLNARNLAQTELQYNQDLLNEAQRLGLLGSWELDLVSGKLRWSDEIYRIFELDPARFSPSYENFLNAIHPDDRDRVNQAYTQSLQDRQSYDVTHRLLLADGRIKWVREYCTSKFDASGKPLRSVGAVQDITERKQAEEELRKSHDELVEINHQLQDTQNQLMQADKMASIGQLAAGVAHEINNPIGYVYSNLGTLEKYVQDAF